MSLRNDDIEFGDGVAWLITLLAKALTVLTVGGIAITAAVMWATGAI